MKSAATTAPLFTGPFALGTFSAPGRTPSAGLVLPDGRVLDLRTTALALWSAGTRNCRACTASRAIRPVPGCRSTT